MSRKGQALSVLIVHALAFTVCFMVWMMFAVIGIPILKTLSLNATEFGLLTATPVLSGLADPGAVLGMGPTKVLAAASSCSFRDHRTGDLADGLRHPVLAVPRVGLVLGLAGARSRSARLYVARWFPKNGRVSRWACSAPATRAPR